MKRSIHLILILVLSFGLIQPAVAGGGSEKTEPTPTAEPELNPEQQAVAAYNIGVGLRDKAWKLEKTLAAASEEKKREKLSNKIPKTFRRAAAEFERATQQNPAMFEAHSDLGYCLRRLGDYEAALAAYDRALDLSPDYAKAIEYRAEAYLGLNRVDDAKQAYMRLFQEQSDEAPALLQAMERWVSDRSENPGDAAADTIEAFSAWVGERAEIAGRTQSVSQLKDADW